MTLTRRDFLRYSAATAVTAAGAHRLVTWSSTAQAVTLHSGDGLYITAGDYLMIDEHPVFMRRFTTTAAWPAPLSQSEYSNLWEPLIFEEGQTIDFTVTNTLDEPHQFVITDVEGVSSDPTLNPAIAPDESRRFTFAAPPPGTYIFHDENPVNRVLGLVGVLNVLPRDGIGDYMGLWGGDHEIVHDHTWIFHAVDDRWGELARAGMPPDEIYGTSSGCLPRYFLINGKSGAAATSDPSVVIHGHINEPALIRLCNTGLAFHSPHFHGNHVLRLTLDGQPQTPRMWKDIVVLTALNRVEVVLPFREPPDVVPGTLEALTAAGLARSGSPWLFPMHCHAEMSQSAGGGNYPQGALADWEIEGP